MKSIWVMVRAAAMCLVMAVAASAQGKTISIGENDANKQVDLKVGDRLVITLSTTPSTGYSWFTKQMDGTLIKSEPTRLSKPAEMPGAAQEIVLPFLAIAPGGAPLVLIYWRPWEKGVEPAKKFRVLVTVGTLGGVPKPKAVTLDENDNRGEVTLTDGDILTINLPAKPSTGYSWVVDGDAPSILKPIAGVRAKAARAPMGASTLQQFRFKISGKADGQKLVLIYKRGWEPASTPPAQRFEVTTNSRD